MKMAKCALAAWAFSGVAVEGARGRKKFSVDPPEQVESKDRSQKLLPPKFIAEKYVLWDCELTARRSLVVLKSSNFRCRYGVAEGDQLSEDIAKKIHDESEALGERPPNFFK
jgi:hypothetical protein